MLHSIREASQQNVATCAFHSIWVKNLLRGIPGAIERSSAIKIVVILAAITGVALFIEEMWRLPRP
jgi:hypothetical protein